MNNIYGIDTNHHHPVTNWNSVKNYLASKNLSITPGFVMVRLGYSSTTGNGGLCLDRIALDSLKQCNALNIPVGVYVYSYDHFPAAAIKTMNEAMNILKNYTIDYPVVYDIEYEPFNRKCGKDMNTAIVMAAMNVIEKAGYYGMIYASRDFFKNYLHKDMLKSYDKWEAAYTAKDSSDVTNGIWQFSSKGVVPGITGNVDLNVSYRDYKTIIEKAGLNGKHKNNVSASPVLYDVTIKNISKGDCDSFLKLAEKLKITATTTTH